jgi:hypothetical protein
LTVGGFPRRSGRRMRKIPRLYLVIGGVVVVILLLLAMC